MPREKRKVDHILTENTEKELFSGVILDSLIRGEGTTVVFVPHAGRSKAINFIVDKSEDIGFSVLGKYKIIVIDQEKLFSGDSGEVFRLMAQELGIEDNDGEDYLKLLRNLEKGIFGLVKQGIHLIIIFKQWERLEYSTQFYNNLVFLWRLDKTKIHYVFCTSHNIFLKEKLEKYGKLSELVNQNRIYYPLFLAKDRETVMDELTKKYKYQPTKKQKELIGELSGGHPYLIKLGLRESVWLKDENKEAWLKFLTDSWEVNKIFQDILEAMDGEDKRIVGLIAVKEKYEYEKTSEYLRRMKIVVNQDGAACLFSEAFKRFLSLKKIDSGCNLVVDKKNGEISVNGIVVSDNFSLNEHKLLIFLIESKNQVVSREKVAEILWGKDSYEKYSDWAIDKALYNLRKKMDTIGCKDKLQAIRRRGYRLIN